MDQEFSHKSGSRYFDSKGNPVMFVNVREASVILGVGQTKMNELLKARALPSRKLGRRTIIATADIFEFARQLPTR